MKIFRNLNKKELKNLLAGFGIGQQEAEKEIRETIENGFLWFRIGGIVCTYTPGKRKKWALMYR